MKKNANRFKHLEMLWRTYTAHPTARQADKWLAAYFRGKKSYGKSDRTWYSEAFFQSLRRVISVLPQEKTLDAAMAWAVLQDNEQVDLLRQLWKSIATAMEKHSYAEGYPKHSYGKTQLLTPNKIHQAGLPQSWLAWLGRSSLVDDKIEGFLHNLNQKPPLYLRANYPDIAMEIQSELEEEGFSVKTIVHDRLVTFSVEGQKPIYGLACLKKGLVEIQDYASQLLGEAVDAHPGMAVWDVCAGGGGKTMQIASQLKNRGVIYASDVREYKLEEIKLRARRAQFHNIRRFVVGTAALDKSKEIQNTGGFHRILVDAPCSASGTLRRNPDVRFRIQKNDPEIFAQTQKEILNSVCTHLKKNGKLVYATCSVFKEENENTVQSFLEEHPNFFLEKSQLVGAPLYDSDTMFYAILQRK
ncbi:MAG: Ribosomal RNA small subunit methyltransferase B [Turneriella sp.]|nr:Ribosomal RNA small subunit methyltransferase B [Turneriella sp.]